ncbi:MAG: hypothetical protein AAF702_21710 [Chloroflexota bacterium]
MLKFFAVVSNQASDFVSDLIDSATFKSFTLLVLALVLGLWLYQEPQSSHMRAPEHPEDAVSWTLFGRAKAISMWQEESPLVSPIPSPDGENRKTETIPNPDGNEPDLLAGESPLETPQSEATDANLVPTEEPTSDPPTPTWTATLIPTFTPTPTVTVTLMPTDTPSPTVTPSGPEPLTGTAVITSSLPIITATLTNTVATTETVKSTGTAIPSVDTAIDDSADSGEPVDELSVSSDVASDSMLVSEGVLEREASLAALSVPFDGLLQVESLILSLLCLIFLSINGLGLTALVVTLFYVRSRREPMGS